MRLRQRSIALTAPTCTLCTPSAWAMRQCPEEFGPKPIWFEVVGLGLFGLLVLTGLLLAFVLVRAGFRQQPRRLHVIALRLLGGLLLALAFALAGLGVWLVFFVLPC